MRSILAAMALFLSSGALAAEPKIQSEFVGPVRVKIWKHWQAAWNVEDVTDENWKFKLSRGTDAAAVPYVAVVFKDKIENAELVLRCDSLQRPDAKNQPWTMAEVRGSEQKTDGEIQGNVTEFKVPNSGECLDTQAERIVTWIEFRILRQGKSVWDYGVRPMFVRGKQQYVYNNKTEAYQAHAGTGAISIARLSRNPETSWDGTVVTPRLDFVDRNTLAKDATIGLHRHEYNQEAYYLENGEAEMWMGKATLDPGKPARVRRKWNDKGEEQDTDEYKAGGGWLEKRTLYPGQVAIIVPNAAKKDPNDLTPHTAYFHGIKALSDLQFWTMGAEN